MAVLNTTPTTFHIKSNNMFIVSGVLKMKCILCTKLILSVPLLVLSFN